MPTLAGLNGASLVPNTADLISTSLDAGDSLRSRFLTPDLVQRVQAGDQQALAELTQINPQALQNLFAGQSAQGNLQAQQLTQQVTQGRAEALETKGNLNAIMAGGAEGLRNNISKFVAKRGDTLTPEETREIVDIANLATTDPDAAFEQLEASLAGINNDISIAGQILGQAQPSGFTLSEGQQRFDASGNVIATGRAKTQDGRGTLAQVQSSQILPTGATVQVFKDGSTRVTGPQGEPLVGQAREDAVREAQEFGIEVQSRRAGGRAEATGAEQRAGALIVRGIAAAESTATVRRALSLLDKVKTGGLAAISLAAKQRLGIEGADEGELSNSLGKSVLSQLRETFGAAFTENEGLRLERIEAAFGKSPETNRRLLGQVLRIAESTAKRAAKTARDRGREAEAVDIEELLTFSLDIDETPADQAQGQPQSATGGFRILNIRDQ